MKYARLVNNEIEYAKEYFVDEEGKLIPQFTKNKDLLDKYGFKKLIEILPEYNIDKENYRIKEIIELEEEIKIVYEIYEIDLAPIKNENIMKTKEDLAAYLFNNPIFSTCHYKEGAYYSATSEKQSQLTQLLTSYILDMQIGVVTELHWNSTGNMCETYTFEELTQLRREMYAFVLPLVSLQQFIEVQIRKAETITDIESIDKTINIERAIELENKMD